jgi:NTP pyrophosphatase (non-canonical NTP hydrolase)
MIDWAQLIAERDVWVNLNFPPYPGEIPGNDSILGLIEENGELAHAHLKAKQGIRGTPEEHEAAMRDAIGDIVIYLLGVMSANCRPTAIQPTEVIGVSREDCIYGIARQVGALSYYAYKHNLDGEMIGAPNWEFSVNRILGHCQAFCFRRRWDFEEIVMSTWDHVSKRDWQKHRAEGAARDDPAVRDPEPISVKTTIRNSDDPDYQRLPN